MAIRVVLAEDHYLVREGIRQLIEAQPDIDLVAVCEDLDSLIKAIDEEKPDAEPDESAPTGRESSSCKVYCRKDHCHCITPCSG